MYVCIVLLFSCVVCVVCCLVSLLLGLVNVMMLYRAHTTQLPTLMGGGEDADYVISFLLFGGISGIPYCVCGVRMFVFSFNYRI